MNEPLNSVLQWLQDHEAELLSDTQAMLQIPSIEEESLDGAPYGQPCRDALDLALRLGSQYGFSTKDIDHKVGFAEFGSGKGLVVSLGHLDVVPVGPGWKFPPFSATISDGYLYSRGAVDDKGPTMAAFYAARAIKECAGELGSRIRIVFGCDEESGMTCVERYTETEETPTFGIAPDSMWPLVHAEKGICSLYVQVPAPTQSIQLVSMSGGDRLNIVIDRVTAVVSIEDSAMAHVREHVLEAWDKNVLCEFDGNELKITCVGKAAHGSTPWYGDSAATRLFRFLAEISPIDSRDFFVYLLDMTHPSGVGVGIHGQDDVSYDLTSNTGVVSFEQGTVTLAINVRYPVTWKGEHARSLCENHLAKSAFGASLVRFEDSPSLYFPLEHPLVKIVTEEYVSATGDPTPPGVMGGGTYARKIANTVSVGTGWPGDGEAHQTNEKLKIDNLYRMSQIYARILLRLAEEASKV